MTSPPRDRPPSHAKIVRSAAGQSWCGSPGKRVVVENRTLCGGEYTLGDLRLNKHGRLPKLDEPWLTCARCRDLLGLTPLPDKTSP